MRAKTISEGINFERGKDPKAAMKIGKAYLEDKWKALQNGSEYIKENTFEDDDFMVHVFGKVYEKWKAQAGTTTPKDIAIWSSRTSGGASIIKIEGPGMRETTLLRGEAFYNLVSDDIMKLLESEEIKQKIADTINQKSMDSDKLARMIFENGNRRQLTFGSISWCYNMADRFIELDKKGLL